MAWKGKVAKKTLNQAAGVFVVDIDYFDDADPAVVIVRRQIPLPAAATLAEIQLHVRSEGARERAKFNALAALDARINVGDEVFV